MSRPPYPTPAELAEIPHLTREQIIERILDLQMVSYLAKDLDWPRMEHAIACLEAALAGRGFEWGGGGPEPTPPSLAQRLALEALVDRDPAKLERALAHMDVFGLWLTTRRIRQVASLEARVSCSVLILHELDSRLASADAAKGRRAFVSGQAMPVEDLDVYLAACIDAWFATILVPRER